MEGFKDMNKWLRFGLGAVVALVLLFALVFEISIPLPIFETQAPEPVTSIGAQAVRERISIDSRDDVYLFNGADLYVYSDDHSTQKFHVDGATGNVTTAGTGAFTGAITASGGVAGDVTGALVLGANDFVTLTPGTSITVTNGAAFTPTATYQQITAAGAVTPTITAGATAGRLVILQNASDQTITLADSGTLMLTAAAALGQYDTLTLISDGTNWIEISRADN